MRLSIGLFIRSNERSRIQNKHSRKQKHNNNVGSVYLEEVHGVVDLNLHLVGVEVVEHQQKGRILHVVHHHLAGSAHRKTRRKNRKKKEDNERRDKAGT